MKIVVLEPNLINTTGHVYEATRALDQYLKDQEYNYAIVCHKDISKVTKDVFTKIYPLATQSCFENENYELVTNYMLKVIRELKLTDADLLIFTTAHLNEIRGMAALYQRSLEPLPKTILQIHQYYRPHQVIDSVFSKENEEQLLYDYSKAGEEIRNLSGKITVVTTLVPELGNRLSDVLNIRVKCLPVPFSPAVVCSKTGDILNNIGFFGDGRKEKGLLTFLHLVAADTSVRYRYFIQLQNIRGMDDAQQKIYYKLVRKISNRPNVKFIHGPLSSSSYYSLLAKIDLLVVPYEKKHYKERMSGIAIEAGLLGIPVIATEDTSIAHWITQQILSGTVFKVEKNMTLTVSNLQYAIKLIDQNYADFLLAANKYKEINLNTFSAANYVQKYLLNNKNV